jgi:hypothetical protein
MHLTLRHISVLLIILYLCLPAMGFAHVDIPDSDVTQKGLRGEATGSLCDHCPCSDEQDSRCCDTDFCSCAFNSPPVRGVQLNYAPVVLIVRHIEAFWELPQVYVSIFVPPQNPSPELFPVAI